MGLVENRSLKVATPADPLRLQRGGVLEHVTVAFQTYGSLNADGSNAVLVAHALTGSAHAAGVTDQQALPGWWDPLIGPGKPIDTNRFFVICSNVLGGCYGTTGPSSPKPGSGAPYGPEFPHYTVRDMVAAQRRLMQALGVRSLRAVIGGSMGGMQVLEWAVSYPEMVRAIAPIAVGARHSAWAIGLNEVARRAIMADPAWNGGAYAPDHQPETGLGLARAIAMITYRSYDSLEQKFGRERLSPPSGSDAVDASFQIASYLEYQGVKLVKRFDANTYIQLTRAMDDYDVSEGRGSLAATLGRVSVPALVMGIDTDVLYPESEARALAGLLPDARYERIRSPHGHDAFLIEYSQLAIRLRQFLAPE